MLPMKKFKYQIFQCVSPQDVSKDQNEDWGSFYGFDKAYVIITEEISTAHYLKLSLNMMHGQRCN